MNKQKGIVPLVLILILGLVVVGGGATVYKNKEVILNKLPKPSGLPTVFFKPTSVPGEIKASPPKAEMAKESVNYKTKGTEVEGLPNINMYPPKGWEQLSSSGDDVLVFEAPEKDYTWEGESNLWTQARISIRVTKSEGETLEEAAASYKDQMKNLMPTVFIYENKDLIGGVEAYYLEADHDLRDITRKEYVDQVRASGKSLSIKDSRKLDKLLEIEKIRSASYILQKNGYDIIASGRASFLAWDKRGPAIIKSLQSISFLGK